MSDWLMEIVVVAVVMALGCLMVAVRQAIGTHHRSIRVKPTGGYRTWDSTCPKCGKSWCPNRRCEVKRLYRVDVG